MIIGGIVGLIAGYIIGDTLGTGIIFAKLHFGMAGRHLFAAFGAVIDSLAACCMR